MKRFLMALLLMAFAATASAQITIPTTFVAGTTIRASEVNSNFSTLGTNALNRTGGTITGNISVDNGITVDSVNLKNLRTTGTPTFSALNVTNTVTAATFSGSGASLTSIPETAITDGSLLARLGSNDTVTGNWIHSGTITLNGIVTVGAAATFNSTAQFNNTVTFSGTVSGTYSGTWNGDIIAVGKLGTGVPAAGKYLAGDGSWQVLPAGTGTVTSVGLSMPAQFNVSNSPVTSSGTLTAAWASQSANLVLAAPNGTSGTPTFRSLVAGDLPTITALGTVTTGVWHGSTIEASYLATNITSLGTVTTGHWHADVIDADKLGSGTPSATTWLRGDGAWTAVATSSSIAYNPIIWDTDNNRFIEYTGGKDLSDTGPAPNCVENMAVTNGIITALTVNSCTTPELSPAALMSYIQDLRNEIAALKAQLAQNGVR